jgi:hypothetical protein
MKMKQMKQFLIVLLLLGSVINLTKFTVKHTYDKGWTQWVFVANKGEVTIEGRDGVIASYKYYTSGHPNLFLYDKEGRMIEQIGDPNLIFEVVNDILKLLGVANPVKLDNQSTPQQKDTKYSINQTETTMTNNFNHELKLTSDFIHKVGDFEITMTKNSRRHK